MSYRWPLIVGILVLAGVSTLFWARRPQSGKRRTFTGQSDLAGQPQAKVRARFANGRLKSEFSDEPVLRWACEVEGDGADPQTSLAEPGAVLLDLSGFAGIDCGLMIPSGRPFSSEGTNGLVRVLRPQAPIDVTLGNGQIAFAPAPYAQYRFELSLRNGRSDSFPSSEAEDAIPVKLSVENGQLSYEEGGL